MFDRRLATALMVPVAAVSLAGCGINSVPTRQEEAKQAWANVQAAYQARADLIPQLVGTVRGAARIEEETLTNVINARARATQVTVNADQLSDLSGAALAAEFGGLSADHIEHTNAAGVMAMREAGTVAVLLPGAFHVLRETKLPPLDALRKAGVPMAVQLIAAPRQEPLLLRLGHGFETETGFNRLRPETLG